MARDVALVLSSGGPRGFAYIGAIEELQARGYRITSVAGCSIGSLVGGIFAAGGIDAFKEWLFALDHFKVMSLMDFSISRNHLVKGERVIRAIEQVVPDVRIEDLPVPFACVATDLYTGEPVVFREGPLFDAIRASISIPSMFRPVKWRHRTLIDGGIVNTFPLDLVQRHPGDIVFGFDVNVVDTDAINRFLLDVDRTEKDEEIFERRTLSQIDKLRRASDVTLIEKVRRIGGQGRELLRHRLDSGSAVRRLTAESAREKIPVSAEDNYYTILNRSFSLMNHTIAALQSRMAPPEILVTMPFDAYSTIADYGRGREIAEYGRTLTAEALDRYEANQ